MLHSLKLLLPALIPSWNFFDTIAPSPRIQYTLLDSASDAGANWQESRPRPQRVSFSRMLRRMIWNPHWNESLFMMSCAERLLEYPTKHSEDEILKRVARDIQARNAGKYEHKFLQFRLVLIRREGGELKQELAYESGIVPLANYHDEGKP